jgi:hypothetical protein
MTDLILNVKFALPLCIAVATTLALGGCSSTSAIDSIPVWAGGETAGTPQRLATEMEYPAVNERPPSRGTTVVTEEEQAKIERDLTAARDSQARQAAQVKKDRAGMLANAPKSPNAPPADTKAATDKPAPKKPTSTLPTN